MGGFVSSLQLNAAVASELAGVGRRAVTRSAASIRLRAVKCWQCGEEVPEDVDKQTIGGGGLAPNAYATAFDGPTFEHAFCPACSAGLRRQVGHDSDMWEPIAE